MLTATQPLLWRCDGADRGLPGSPHVQACPGCSTTTAEPGRFCPECGAVLAAPADAGVDDPSASLIGGTLGDFAIEAVIGRGSFGTVYRARQLGLDRMVAVKIPSRRIAMDPIQALRFAREARAAARVVHPGVVAIYAVGEIDDGRPYLAMQLIEGEPLDRIVAHGPIPVSRALRIARSIASALAETHAANVVHRDLKPSNIMWRCDRRGDDLITLVDFGIAVCQPGHSDASRLTTTGLVGTPHYMSPEQAHGEQVDGRADLYALGCVMFELVTGATPFDGSGFEVLLAHLSRPPPLASSKNPAVPDVVDRLIAQLMAKAPGDRPETADAVVAMCDDALDVLEGPISGSWRSHGRPAALPARRSGAALPRSCAVAPPDPAAASDADLAVPRQPAWPGVLAAIAVAALVLIGAGFAVFHERHDLDEQKLSQARSAIELDRAP